VEAQTKPTSTKRVSDTASGQQPWTSQLFTTKAERPRERKPVKIATKKPALPVTGELNTKTYINPVTKQTTTVTMSDTETSDMECTEHYEIGEFQLVPKRRKVQKQSAEPPTKNIAVSNRYETLVEEPKANPTVIKKATNKTKPPPPIVISGNPTNHSFTMSKLREALGDDFHIKFTNNNTNLYIHTQEKYSQYKETLAKSKVPFHTYSNKSEKTHAFVVHGFWNEPEPEEITAALNERHEIPVIKTYRMSTRKRPLYMVVTKTEVTLRHLTKINKLLNVSVTWERHVNKKGISQCHRCQAWGHATSNCYKAYKCLKCAGEHNTILCKIEDDAKRTCANCGGDHPASSTECVNYQKIIKLRKITPRELPAKQQQKFVPAPPPARNAWTSRSRSRNYEEDYEEEYPALPRRRNPTPPPTEQPQKRTATHSTSNEEDIDSFLNLNSAFRELNQLINIRQMTTMITDLNVKLRQCRTNAEKFITYQTFLTSLDD